MPDYTPISTCNQKCSPQLNIDIISHIFSLNADMECATEGGMYPALVTLRHSSQVCASWRQLAIGSPLLWAHVLNLNLLSQRTDQWMKEVLRRTGTALLHIKSIDYGFNMWPLAVGSVQWILTEHWKRIRSLDLQLSMDFGEDKQMWPQWRRIFQRPAPSLEVFRFSWSDGDECFSTPNFSLFSDDAPSLRTFFVPDMPVRLSFLSAPNLRNLVLHSAVSAFNLLSVLEEKMPLLETFEFTSASPFLRQENTQQSVPRVVTLPRLATLKFSPVHYYLNTALEFLAHIIPGDGCVLYFLGATHKSSDRNDNDLYRRILSRYSQSCTELQTATNLEANFLQDRFSLLVHLSSSRRFRFAINSLQFPEGTMSTVLSSFTGMQLNNLNTLKLHLADPVRLDSALTKFVYTLNSVEDLETDCSTLYFLHDVQRSTTVITFPALRIVHLNRISYSKHLLPVADFINTRVELGIPLDTLTVTMRGSSTADVETLRNLVPGLMVEIKMK